MKLGVLQFFSWLERRVDLATVYARALERIEIMDRTGYDRSGSPSITLAALASVRRCTWSGHWLRARTKRLRIGTAVSLAPFYHPLRLAEEVALLDLLSGGRVNWGAGRGFARVEFTAFGVPSEESVSHFHSRELNRIIRELIRLISEPRDLAVISISGARLAAVLPANETLTCRHQTPGSRRRFDAIV